MEYNFNDIKILINEKRKNNPENLKGNLEEIKKGYIDDKTLFSINLNEIISKLEKEYNEGNVIGI